MKILFDEYCANPSKVADDAIRKYLKYDLKNTLWACRIEEYVWKWIYLQYTYNEETCLMVACRGNLDVIKFLVEKGSSIDEENSDLYCNGLYISIFGIDIMAYKWKTLITRYGCKWYVLMYSSKHYQLACVRILKNGSSLDGNIKLDENEKKIHGIPVKIFWRIMGYLKSKAIRNQ